ncbi:hypothetical protein Ciccas_008872 [Cichlidogyrus casuarinus]|uniref:Uncharacterized protein n=1 Tax=Cichlidogyrus casuarinus TaxID=1844966 RepID=A0ABD2PZ96_9PLAT
MTDLDLDPFSAAPVDKSSLMDWQRRHQFPMHSSTPWTQAPAVALSGYEQSTGGASSLETKVLELTDAVTVSNGMHSSQWSQGIQSFGPPIMALVSHVGTGSTVSTIPPLQSLSIEPVTGPAGTVNVSPFLGGPPIAAPTDHQQDLSRGLEKFSPTNLDSFWGSKPVFSPQTTSSLFLLPVEPSPLSVNDPFDTAWAEQATSSAKMQAQSAL